MGDIFSAKHQVYASHQAAKRTNAGLEECDQQNARRLPEFAWALRNRADFPVDVNRAPREPLLRIPAIGVRSVDR
ncbi:MAG: radical SAM protein, partial [Verrucomicrobiota bacterium]